MAKIKKRSSMTALFNKTPAALAGVLFAAQQNPS
jgi:hypothetical protein